MTRARAAWGLLVGAALLVSGAPAAPAHAGRLTGVWDGPVGRVRVSKKGDRLTGVLVGDSPVCPFKKGDRVLEGNLLLGNIAGKVRLCTLGCAGAGETWAFSMMVASGRRISGAAAIDAGAGCRVPGRSAKGGVVFVRPKKNKPLPPRDPPPGTRDPPADESPEHPVGPHEPGTYDPRMAADVRQKALNVARDGAQFLEEGRFEKARARFLEAVAIDPEYAEGYNGVGVTHALRRDWRAAVGWYQKSIAANPDIGDAYYNLACAYAQTNQPELALRYLRLAVLNGYSEVEHLKSDPDLEPLHDLEAYQSVLRLSRLGALGP